MDKLRLSNKNKKICGLCGGIGECLSIDPAIIRIIFVLMLFLFQFYLVILYFICWIILPANDEE